MNAFSPAHDAGPLPSGHRHRVRTVSVAEQRLWHLVMHDVAPLPGRSISAVPPPAATCQTPHVTDIPDPDMRAPSAHLPRATPETAGLRPVLPVPLVLGTPPGLDRRTDDRLRRGRMTIEGRIDLHGMVQAEAHGALNAFVHRGWREGRRCLLVITGKGNGGRGNIHASGAGDSSGGVLYRAVPRWLAEAPLRPLVLAIHRAQPRDGGDGALYVLLRRGPHTR